MEIVVAMTIIGAVMASASLFFINGLRATGGQSQRQAAVTLASQKLELVQSIAPKALVSGRDCQAIYDFTHSAAAAAIVASDQIASSRTDQGTAGNCDSSTPPRTQAVPYSEPATLVNGTSYTVDTYINICWLAGTGSAQTCGPTNLGGSLTKMFRVSVDVFYQPAGGLRCSGLVGTRCDYVASTLLDPSADPTFNSNVIAPTVTSTQPASVKLNTATSVVLTGRDFASGVAVSIAPTGGVITGVTSNTGTKLTFTLQAGGTAGTYTITLLNPDGGRATTSITETAPPQIISVTPTSVTAGSTTTLTINGAGFQSGLTIAVGGGGSVSEARVLSPTQATVTYIANGDQPGQRSVTLTNPDGGTATATFAVTSSVPNPVITSVSPGSLACSTYPIYLNLTGTGFERGATVSDGVDAFNPVTWYWPSSAQVVAFRNLSDLSTRTLTFTNPDGGKTTYRLRVDPCPAPMISSLNPSWDFRSGSTFTVYGSSFLPGATVTITKRNGAGAGDISSASYVSSGQLAFTWTLPKSQQHKTTSYTFTVTNPDGQSVAATTNVTVE